jgi:hypothetical protein
VAAKVIKMDLPVDFVDAKPFWSALYHSLTFVMQRVTNIERHRFSESALPVAGTPGRSLAGW